jgi:hypothetical protein
MPRELDALKTEIQAYLEENGFALFHGCSRMMDDLSMVHWDILKYPEYQPFLAAARQLGVKMIVLHHREFTEANIDDALQRLEDCDLPLEESRTLTRRLEDSRMYVGFTCALELSFDFQDRVYMFDLRADWYLDFLDAIEDIEPYFDDDDDEDDDGPIGGYYSRN